MVVWLVPDLELQTIKIQIMMKKEQNLQEPQKQALNTPVASSSFAWAIYENQLAKIKQLPQTQTSLMKQLEILRPFANKLGLYDTADYLRNDR